MWVLSLLLLSYFASFAYSSKPEILLVLWDPVRGFLNWIQPRFINHALNDVSIRCLFASF